MAGHGATNAVLVRAARQAIAAAAARGAALHLLGGLGIYVECGGFQGVMDEHREPFSDIDLFCLSAAIGAVESAFAALGWEQNATWRMHFGFQRRIFYTPEGITVEVFIDKLFLCQEIDLRGRLALRSPSLAPTDLFLSRIQRVRLLPKDVLDLSILLSCKTLGGAGSDTIDLGAVTALAARSWPWWATIRDNLGALLAALPPCLPAEPLRSRLRECAQAIETAPKSLRWKLRAAVGRRLQWYRDVE